jgi:hypothetical protein
MRSGDTARQCANGSSARVIDRGIGRKLRQALRAAAFSCRRCRSSSFLGECPEAAQPRRSDAYPRRTAVHIAATEPNAFRPGSRSVRRSVLSCRLYVVTPKGKSREEKTRAAVSCIDDPAPKPTAESEPRET